MTNLKTLYIIWDCKQRTDGYTAYVHKYTVKKPTWGTINYPEDLA